MSDAGIPTLDQLRVFAAVVAAGSFSAAARRLNRTQSVISYTVANLEAQLGVALFNRDARRPVLTEAGHALVGDARRIGLQVDELRARATALRRGLEPELRLVADVMFPTGRLVTALNDFALAYPSVSVRLWIEGLGAVVQRVLDGECQLGVSGWTGVPQSGLEWRDIGELQLVPVAAPSHPLARASGPIRGADLCEQVQLVLADRSRITEGQDFGVLALRTWRLGDLGAKHALLLAGLGWGSMPLHVVEDDLAAGRLVRLHLRDAREHRYPISLIHRTDAPPGPAGQWMAERLGMAERPGMAEPLGPTAERRAARGQPRA